MRLTRTFLMPRGALDVFVELTNATVAREPLLCRVQGPAERRRLDQLRARVQFLAAVDAVGRSAVAILTAKSPTPPHRYGTLTLGNLEPPAAGTNT